MSTQKERMKLYIHTHYLLKKYALKQRENLHLCFYKLVITIISLYIIHVLQASCRILGLYSFSIQFLLQGVIPIDVNGHLPTSVNYQQTL